MTRKAKTAAPATSAQDKVRSSATAASSVVQGKRFDDQRPSALAQRALNESIAHSPRIVAQRAQIAMMRGETAQRKDDGAALSSPNRTGLPDTLKAGVESLSGLSMDHVRVHYNSDKPAALNAHAYAQGSDIHVAPGQEQHLPHEAWHVVQQAQGRVKPTMQMKGETAVNDDPALESEADSLGAQALGVGQLLVKQAGEMPGAPAKGGERVSQRARTLRHVATQSSDRPAQLAKYTWTGSQWIDDGTGSSSRAVGPKPVGDFVGQVYDDSTGQYSTQATPFHGYLDPTSYQNFYPEKEEHLPVGRLLQGHTGPIAMPLEWVGDLAERLLQKWLRSIGIEAYAQQNKSGHGLDLIFRITTEQLGSLPDALKGVFSNFLPKTESATTRGGRTPKPTWRTEVTEVENQSYLVVLEVKVNSAQLSKGQRNADQYVYKQSKTSFGLGARTAIEAGDVELFYEVNVNVAEDATHDVRFEFNQTDEESRKGLPKENDTVDYHSDEPFDFLNSKHLGDAGEQFAKETLAQAGYKSIGSLQNASGHGVDIVAVDPSGKIVFFEVKTHAGDGKKARLTKREQQQHAFVAAILIDIIQGTGDYGDVPAEIVHQAGEIYSTALAEDQQAREDRNAPPVALGAYDTNAVVRNFLAAHARYFVMDVYFPTLGQTGRPAYTVSHWNAKQ